MQKFLSVLTFLGVTFSQPLIWAQAQKPIYVLHLRFGNNELRQQIESELNAKMQEGQGSRRVEVIVPNLNDPKNPFGVSLNDFNLGQSRPPSGKVKGPTPLMQNTQWFVDQLKQGKAPEVLIINGHHVPALGFHSDSDHEVKGLSLWDKSLHMMTFFQSIKDIPEVREYFKSVKLVFLGGCYGLSNLEPKSESGSGKFLDEKGIEFLNQTNQKDKLLGTGTFYNPTGLMAQWRELYTEYSYVKSAAEEDCVDTENRTACHHYHVFRVLPLEGLWDGSHMYNLPWHYKRAFPSAYAIVGFNTPSPLKPGYIWKATFDGIRKSMREKGFNYTNILQPLLNNDIDVNLKKEIVKSLRVSWTESSYFQNRNRTSGSISPIFPDLDKNGLFEYSPGFAGSKKYAPEYAPYEAR